MSTITNALRLLDFFTGNQSQIGLSNLASMAGYDKAKTHRYLLSLMASGMIEKNSETHEYRLGVALLHLAQAREASFPLQSVMQHELKKLSAMANETVHGSLLSGSVLSNIAVVESPQINRIVINRGGILPFHATASGLAVLAFNSDAFVNTVLQEQPLDKYTNYTLVDALAIRKRIADIRKQGYVYSSNGYEEGVSSLAFPTFNTEGFACGALSIVTPATRMTAAKINRICIPLANAAKVITASMAGKIPGNYPYFSAQAA